MTPANSHRIALLVLLLLGSVSLLRAESIPEKVDRLDNLVAQLRAKLDAAERRSQSAEAAFNQLKSSVDAAVEKQALIDSGIEQMLGGVSDLRNKVEGLRQNTTALVGNALTLRNAGKVTAWLDGKDYGSLYLSNGAGTQTVLIDGKNGAIKFPLQSSKDVAEVFELSSRDHLKPGSVVAISRQDASAGQVGASSEPRDPRVIGVVSGAGSLSPALVLGKRSDGSADLPVAVSGTVYVRVNLENGPIEPGSLLVSSSVRGVAMKADIGGSPGAVLGKALEAYTGGQDAEGLIPMLVAIR